MFIRLKDYAYGVTIRDQIKRLTGREYLYSTRYTTTGGINTAACRPIFGCGCRYSNPFPPF